MNLKLERAIMHGHYMGPLCPEDAKRNPEKVQQAMIETTKEMPKVAVGLVARAAGLEFIGEAVEVLFSDLG